MTNETTARTDEARLKKVMQVTQFSALENGGNDERSTNFIHKSISHHYSKIQKALERTGSGRIRILNVSDSYHK